MPKPPEYSLCETLHEGDVVDLLAIAMELAPNRYDELLTVARNDQLSVETRAGILTGVVNCHQEDMAREIDKEKTRARRREVLTGVAVWVGQASVGNVGAMSLFRPFGRRLPGN